MFILKNSTPEPINQEVQLKSSCGIEYRELCDLLAQGEWKEADYETGRVMLAVAKREEEGWLDVESIDNFPCEDLSTIDQLWVKYSDGKFGFSVQKRIYQSLGGTREYNEDIWEAFGDKVGWKNKENRGLSYKNITFDEKAQKVNFPNYTILGETDIERNWLYYKDITFDKKAPEAHLPIIIVKYELAWNARMGMWEKDGGGSHLRELGILISSLLSRRDL